MFLAVFVVFLTSVFVVIAPLVISTVLTALPGPALILCRWLGYRAWGRCIFHRGFDPILDLGPWELGSSANAQKSYFLGLTALWIIIPPPAGCVDAGNGVVGWEVVSAQVKEESQIALIRCLHIKNLLLKKLGHEQTRFINVGEICSALLILLHLHPHNGFSSSLGIGSSPTQMELLGHKPVLVGLALVNPVHLRIHLPASKGLWA
ncbi:hypothetical protein B0H14DRAFT_3879252 [Mycena olivaceomarginata]|nr:hypothetical protein B0H14DRAFT_3879252 [Mycena olivaceomarginata]